MSMTQDRNRLIEELSRTMEELSAPELTLGRANVLRPRVARLLAALREATDPPRPLSLADCREGGSWLVRAT
jgi:hypothetical protein